VTLAILISFRTSDVKFNKSSLIPPTLSPETRRVVLRKILLIEGRIISAHSTEKFSIDLGTRLN
jgi:hypothetical protein